MSDQWRGPLAVLWRGLSDQVWLGHSHVAGGLIDSFEAGRIRELKRWAVAQVDVFLNDEPLTRRVGSARTSTPGSCTTDAS